MAVSYTHLDVYKRQAVIRVGAATEAEMKESKLRMEDALAATKAAVEEGIIAGGGSAYIHATKEVAKLAETLEGDEKTGAKVILKALEAPLFYISANAGLEGDVYKRQQYMLVKMETSWRKSRKTVRY